MVNTTSMDDRMQAIPGPMMRSADAGAAVVPLAAGETRALKAESRDFSGDERTLPRSPVGAAFVDRRV